MTRRAPEKRALEFLRVAYEAAEGSGAQPVEIKPLARSLELERRVAEDLTLRLQAQGLLRVVSMANGLLRLTPEGVRAVEDAGNGPQNLELRSQDGFAASQRPSVLDRNDRREVEELLASVEAGLDRLDLHEGRLSELAADINTIEAQLDSPRPKRRIVASVLVSIRSILGPETDAAAADGISRTVKGLLSDGAERTDREANRPCELPGRVPRRGADDGAGEPSTRGASQPVRGVAHRIDGAAIRTGQVEKDTANGPTWEACRAMDRDGSFTDQAERTIGRRSQVAGSDGTFGKVTDEMGRTVWHSVDDAGSVVKTTLNEDGKILAEEVVGNAAAPVENAEEQGS